MRLVARGETQLDVGEVPPDLRVGVEDDDDLRRIVETAGEGRRREREQKDAAGQTPSPQHQKISTVPGLAFPL